jgi:NAD(P)H-hydrate epimerase
MLGAVAMTSLAALRVGAGLVTAAAPRSLLPVLQGGAPEIMARALEETAEQRIAAGGTASILEALTQADVCVIGPGLARYPEAAAIVEAVLLNGAKPCVADADALNALAGKTDCLRQPHGDVVVTPHPGEMARLTGLTATEVQAGRLNVARRYALEWGVTVVLKGYRTLIATPSGAIFINPTGNDGMATAGSGDVLAGIIGGLVAQGLSTEQAAPAGVFLHGLAGDIAARRQGRRAMVASDIIASVAQALLEIEGQ